MDKTLLFEQTFEDISLKVFLSIAIIHFDLLNNISVILATKEMIQYLISAETCLYKTNM